MERQCIGCPAQVYCEQQESRREKVREDLFKEEGIGSKLLAFAENAQENLVDPLIKSIYDSIQNARDEQISKLAAKGIENITQEDILQSAQESVAHLYESGILNDENIEIIADIELQKAYNRKLDAGIRFIEAVDEELNTYDLLTIQAVCLKGAVYAIDETGHPYEECGSAGLTDQQRLSTRQTL